MSDIKINVKIKATSRAIYEAITTQKGLSSWWARNTETRPEVGFANKFTFGDFINKMKVTKLVPNKIVEWECIDSIDEWIGTRIIYDLEEKDEQTLLRFTHSGWKEATDTFAGCTYDWAQFMASLKSLCETGTGSPS